MLLPPCTLSHKQGTGRWGLGRCVLIHRWNETEKIKAQVYPLGETRHPLALRSFVSHFGGANWQIPHFCINFPQISNASCYENLSLPVNYNVGHCLVYISFFFLYRNVINSVPRFCQDTSFLTFCLGKKQNKARQNKKSPIHTNTHVACP